MDTFLEEESQAAKKIKPGTWASMNFIQRTGVIGAIVLFMFSLIFSGKSGIYIGVVGWSLMLFGYVAGSLWRVRHALHFWWSMAFACIVHALLLPVYGYLVTQTKYAPGHNGKGFMYLAAGLVCVETITLIYLLKHAAIWFHRRHATAPHINDLS